VNTAIGKFVGFMAVSRGLNPAVVLPQANVCGRALAESQNAAEKPVIICESLGAHLGVQDTDVYPPPYGTGRENGAIISIFMDGHARLVVGDFYRIAEWGLKPF
jgi:hypothetical protein